MRSNKDRKTFEKP